MAVPHLPDDLGPASDGGPSAVADYTEAAAFIRWFYEETSRGDPADRLRVVRANISATGTYRQTHGELEWGARVAWRNSQNCIGRYYWPSLHLRDRRYATHPDVIAAESILHLREATNRGKIRPTITVFSAHAPGWTPPIIWNEQIVRYAGHRRTDGKVIGDPRFVDFTDWVGAQGWVGTGGRWDVLPLAVADTRGRTRLYEIPESEVLTVPISHPERPWLADLGLRWHALPAITDMELRVGGLVYPCTPFNGWYMGTEIGARNLGDVDRYDMLPAVADGLGVDRGHDRTLWKDVALVVLNQAVLWSFRHAGVSMTDHHTESQRFLRHVAREQSAGRSVPANWSWIVPPISGSATGVFHRYYDTTDQLPNFTRRTIPGPWSPE